MIENQMTNEGVSLDPVKFLTEQYLQRRERNASYSLRSFARDVGVSATALSRILNGQRIITYRQMSRVLSALNVPEELAQKIITGIILKAGKTAKVSKVLRHSFTQKATEASYEVKYYSIDRFKMISQWYHFAILEMTYLKDFESDALWISKKLDISLIETKDAIDRLLNLGFLHRSATGILSKTDSRLFIDAKKAEPEIRKYETTMLAKATAQLDKTDDASYQMRLINSITFPTSPACVPELKKAIYEFQKKLLTMIRQNEYTQVYHFGCQLFPVSEAAPSTSVINEGNNHYESA